MHRLTAASRRSAFTIPDLMHQPDSALIAEVCRSKGQATGPMAALLARHWKPVRTYAALCSASRGSGRKLEEAAAERLYKELLQYRYPAAVRPRLLVAVREAAESDVRDGGGAVLAPAFVYRFRQGGVRPVASRRLIKQAFETLSPPMQTILWHREVERDPAARIALILGLSKETVVTEAERSRGLLLSSCLDLHGRLAPRAECGRYTRLVAASGSRRVPGDVREHMESCLHCRRARDQFDQRDETLPLLLAQAVLGCGAEVYLHARRQS